MTRIFIGILLATSSLAVSACNVVRGAGEDIQSVGNAGDEVI